MKTSEKTANKAKKKATAKALSQKKHHRRQWITFVRMCRYGINNFTRNAWLTIAATAVMTVTLLVIFSTVAARNVLIDTAADLRDQVNMSIYLKTETTDEQANEVISELRQLPSVVSVDYTSPAEGREQFVNDNKEDADTLDAIKEATNRFPGVVNIKVLDINDTSELETFVQENETAQTLLSPDHDPSFASGKRETIRSIGQAVGFAEKVGAVLSGVFIAMSMLIIFNTIRMAIFNRREEIQMMKLIGAEKSFIRGPFIVEAIVYGFIAAIIATGLGYGLLVLIKPTVENFVLVQPTIDIFTYYVAFVLLAMIVIGAIIGIISSLLATRRYLR